jgi:hypothetical protein
MSPEHRDVGALATTIRFGNSPIGRTRTAGHEVHFRSLTADGVAYVFPCDAAGDVDLDALGDEARNDYFYARAVLRRRFEASVVRVAPVGDLLTQVG